MKKDLKQSGEQTTNNPLTSLSLALIVILIFLIAIIAYLVGSTNFLNSSKTSDAIPIPTAVFQTVTPTNSSIPTQPPFDLQGCLNRAQVIGNECMKNCGVKNDQNANNCSDQTCLSTVYTNSNSCLSDCTSTGKIDMNNCTFGRWPQ